MAQKVDIVLRTSKDVLDRFTGLARAINATNENTLAYLLDFYDRAAPGDIRPAGRIPQEARLHTCVAPEIKNKIRQIADEHGMSISQLLMTLLDEHDRHEGRACRQVPAEAPARENDGSADDPMERLETALDTIRDVFRSVYCASRQAVSDRNEIQSLREQLAEAEADAEKAREANRKIQDTLTQLATQLG